MVLSIGRELQHSTSGDTSGAEAEVGVRVPEGLTYCFSTKGKGFLPALNPFAPVSRIATKGIL